MVRNKNQGQAGLKDNRQESQDENRQNSKTPERVAPVEDDQRENTRRSKGLNPRKGSPGKNSH